MSHEEPRGTLLTATEHVLGDSRGQRQLAASIGIGMTILVLFTLLGAFVYATGGTKTAYLHFAYLPILLAASVFGVAGGVIAALASGVVILGPLMPLDTISGARQPLASWLFRTGFFLLIGIVAGLVIGRLRRQLRQIRTASLLDPVSNLPTRLALEQVLARVLRSHEQTEPHALIMLDLKNMDQLFNTLGPEITQHIPAAIANRLRPLCSLPWQIYHVHGGKLALLVNESRNTTVVQTEDMLQQLGASLEVRDVPIYLDAVAGIARFDGGNGDANQVLQQANTALDEARRQGVSFAHFDMLPRRDRQLTLRLLSDTPMALDRDEFQLVFQPQFRLSDERLVGAEALIRWNHPSLGLLGPGQFIPLLEETALIDRISVWVVQAAVRQAADWQASGLELTVAVNVSPRNLNDNQVCDALLEEIARHGVRPELIEVEITESAFISDSDATAGRLADLKAAGLQVALDDFGDGYTSVRHLTSLPIDKLKIDQSLVGAAASDSRRMRIISAVIGMTEDLGLAVLAEGVEDAETADLLTREGCHAAQGFYYSRPVTPEKLFERARIQTTAHAFRTTCGGN